ncbi:MAG TPA: carboxypeptidase regulatory-like domain-containing protein, partial [Candidatus Limnocylindria bacterium]|nr:carboxypeptidase regulatory-like domain-containing protein [Candidatus Limnocylindria bacterium]
MVTACGENGPLPFQPTPEPTPVQPREVAVLAVDRGSDAPVPGAEVSVDGETSVTGQDGSAVVTALPGDRVEITAPGYDPGSETVPDEGGLEVDLRPNVVAGTVTDAAGEPVEGVRVFVDGSELYVRTDADGAYALPGVPESGTLIYKRAGYRLAELPIDEQMTK